MEFKTREPEQTKWFRTAATVVVTAIIQSIIFCLIIGLPLPQFFSSRDVESLQFQQLPEQKRTQPIEALENIVPAPKPTPQPMPQQAAKPAKKPARMASAPVKTPEPAQPEAKASEPTKVLVVNFERSKDEEKKEAKSEEPKIEEPKAVEPQPATLNAGATTEGKLVPASDKLVGVQAADDSKTEATAETNSNPTDKDSSEAMQSMEEAKTAN